MDFCLVEGMGDGDPKVEIGLSLKKSLSNDSGWGVAL